MKINYVNPEHVHTLIDLPTHLCIEEAMQLFKGKFFPLDKPNQPRAWQVCLGARIWRLFGFPFWVPGRWQSTSPPRKNIIGRGAFLKSLSCLWSGTSLSGTMIETVETVSMPPATSPPR